MRRVMSTEPELPGILLLAHAPLASSFTRVAHDMGLPRARLAALDIEPTMSREAAVVAARMRMADLRWRACLVLVDLSGGCSPAIVAQMFLDQFEGDARIVTGLNTAMLATALCHAEPELEALARRVHARGAESIALLGMEEGRAVLTR
jgi:mannose/fructose-specific phosphotransferase system component IIA